MYQRLVSHNADIRALVDKGYAIAFDSNFLVVRDIPYLDHEGQLRLGAFVTVLEFIDQDRVKQQNHQVYFAGGTPHGMDGFAIPNLGSQPASLALSPQCADVVVERALSNKPVKEGAFADFFTKIESYVAIISGPAMDRYAASPLTFRVDETVVEDSVFKFQDTLTSRGEITHLAAKFKHEVIALIGLGGTGAYLLDFLAKTPVSEIRAFDLDPFQVHNAFRSPGKLDPSELGKSKADVYASRYENFRKNLHFVPKYLDATCLDDMEGVTFAFVCVDKGPSRAGIFELLISKGIPFIDVGMGLNQRSGALTGMVRTTYFPPERAAALRNMRLAELNDRNVSNYLRPFLQLV